MSFTTFQPLKLDVQKKAEDYQPDKITNVLNDRLMSQANTQLEAESLVKW